MHAEGANSQDRKAADSDQREPYIAIPNNLPGVAGLALFKPTLGEKFLAFIQQLLRGQSLLSDGERELIAAYVSSGNETTFCVRAHSSTAALLLEKDRETVLAMINDAGTALMSEKMRALLRIAEKVRRSGLQVTPEDVASVRAAGGGDEEIHDTVLIAAAFCMINRYVDGLRAVTPPDDGFYEGLAERLTETGYAIRKRPE